MVKTTLAQYLEAAYKAADSNPSWRWGQTLFNTLYTLEPELANEIRATELDTFYMIEQSHTEQMFWLWLSTKLPN
jgi:hypothetical protein